MSDAPQAARPLKLLARPWFWVLVVSALWLLPLIKALGAELPDPLPGMDSAPIEFSGRIADGPEVRLSDLRGYLVLATPLSLADEDEVSRGLSEFFSLRKRLRGLGSSVVYVLLVRDADLERLAGFLEGNPLRKPTQVFLLDEDGGTLEGLQATSAQPGSTHFLMDTQGRLRGAYGSDEAALDRLVTDAGQLANWRASDPALE